MKELKEENTQKKIRTNFFKKNNKLNILNKGWN